MTIQEHNQRLESSVSALSNQTLIGNGLKALSTTGQKHLRVFEAFAGYGGASFSLKRLANNPIFQKLGFSYEIIGYSEIDKYAIQIYNQNHPNLFNFGDITQIDEKTMPDFDLFTGGFPCQSFSSAGLSLGEGDSRGVLFLDILRIVRHKRPSLILLENVKGLLSKRHKSTLDKIVSELELIGYSVVYKLLNSKDFGVPQNRERVWIFATLMPQYSGKQIHPSFIPSNATISDCLDANPDASLYLSQEQIKKLIVQCGFDLNSQEKLCLDLYNKKLRTDGMCMTLGGIHNTMRLVEPKDGDDYKVRKLSIMEQFRLMGFKDGEVSFSGISYTQLCHILSNGWDINVVSLILRNILSIWISQETEPQS